MCDASPLMIKLEKRKCVVIGGGTVATRKIATLLSYHAAVKVISPEITPELNDNACQFEHEKRLFQKGDLTGAFLAIGATDYGDVNKMVYDEAINSNVPLINIVDNQHLSNFFFPSTVRRGPLQIAVSTNGNSPILACMIRKDLEKNFGPEYEPYVNKIGEIRGLILEQIEDPEEKKHLLRYLIKSDLLIAYKEYDHHKIKKIIDSIPVKHP